MKLRLKYRDHVRKYLTVLFLTAFIIVSFVANSQSTEGQTTDSPPDCPSSESHCDTSSESRPKDIKGEMCVALHRTVHCIDRHTQGDISDVIGYQKCLFIIGQKVEDFLVYMAPEEKQKLQLGVLNMMACTLNAMGFLKNSASSKEELTFILNSLTKCLTASLDEVTVMFDCGIVI